MAEPLLRIWSLFIYFLLISPNFILIKSLNENEVVTSKFQFFSAGKGEKGLFPNIFNLATHAEIRATSTCGQYGPEYYCKLVEHVFLRQPQCDICDANNHTKNHPIDYAIDGTRRWWQSPSLGNGLSYEKVNITIDLRQEYQVAYVIVKAAISPRPGTWILEKSLDGVNFMPWQYFATADSECMRAFGVPATVGVPKFKQDDEVICTSYFSKLNPLEQGEIHTSLVNGRPGAEHSSVALQNFTRTRFVRLRLLGLRTLYADLMVINRRDGKLDQSVTRRYFYSISDISIGGQCICYGHAEHCPPEEIHGQFRCECRHNTCGESCNKCCPLFNQLPWQPGTHDHPNICQACQCFNHATHCVYDPEIESQRLSVTPEGIYEGGGRCIECDHNTEGINCEKCQPSFYRPSNFSHYRHDACHPCDCDSVGSVSNACVRDETEASGELRPGSCVCKPGFGGRRCERCALGFRNYPICEPCPCNMAGSLNYESCEESTCVCKHNVVGEFCDQCKPGTIYLNKDNPLGCQACFCFGKTTECYENKNWRTAFLTANNGWNLTDLYGTKNFVSNQVNLTNPTELLIFNSDEHFNGIDSSSIYYWKAPKNLLNKGNWLNSYGANLNYFVYFVPRGDSLDGYPTTIPDLIIEGNDVKIEYYSRLNFFPRENISITIPLKVAENWVDSRTRRVIDHSDLMGVLADVRNVFIKAKYHQNQLQSSIYGLKLEMAIDSGSEPEDGEITISPTTKTHPIEVCACPNLFVGNSCERCEVGYRRVGNRLYDGMCQKCECQGHSQECHPFTGHCINCQHNTTGTRCEQCLQGYYGNPSLGGDIGSCRQCACPTMERSRSAHCSLSQLVFEGAAAANQDEYVCTACQSGYEGNKCEICADGYFGDPASEEGCRLCDCHGNIDSAAIGNCDRESGVCLRCIGHTSGDHCEKCAVNHWGSALEHRCLACSCHHIGASSLQCDVSTGKCDCREFYMGENCDRCEPGHGDVDNNCPECECNTIGSVGTSCDETSGQCSCKKGVYGKQCDKCIPSYYNFSNEGCKFCACSELGSVPGKECHNLTGECQCLPNVVGLKCELCADSFYNITSKKGCQPCECSEIGSIDSGCDISTGQCRCKIGVSGEKCDRCQPNYYGLDAEGCKKCRVCQAPGQVCDQITGECVCPPNTQGQMCESCTPKSWNYHVYEGCKLCECDGIGAFSGECDMRTGQCKCKSGYEGHKCDQCEAGYFNFPDCEPCNCDLAGTDPLQCKDDQTCLCSNKGQCNCKKHVTGLKCDQCTENAFSLEAHNPFGCTECFCFNRSTSCTQSKFIWKQIYSPDRSVTFEHPFEQYTRKHNIHILRETPLNYNSYPTNYTPLYWPLSRTFLGDRTASYNGYIRFQIKNDNNYRRQLNLKPDAVTLRLFPQILLIGNHRIELEHLPPDYSVPDDGKYKVRLHEIEWRNRISPQLPLSRKQFMVALQNVQAIYIRATYNEMYRGDTISIREISLDVGTDSISSNGGPIALGVELCGECAEGYWGPSCQNAMEGFCRKRDPEYLNNPDDLALVGKSVKCDCKGHSTNCDPENCRCNDCEHNTVGDFCEYCRPGYYGSALESHACHKCACPHINYSFSETCRSVPETHGGSKGYICDACRPGYSGPYCESCSSGYYGDPSIEGGFCSTCACHPFGSVHGICNNVTGQCYCRDGVDGRDCSSCRPRHAFINGLCTSCDQGCYQVLMHLEDQLEYALSNVKNVSGIKPIPRKRLAKIQSTTASLDGLLDNIKSSENDAEALFNKVGANEGLDENRFRKQASVVEQEFELLKERNDASLASLTNLENQLDAIRDQIHQQNQRIVALSSQLAHFAHNSNQESVQPENIHYLVQQAQEYLNSTRERDRDIEKQYNYAKQNAENAERLLKNVLAKKLDENAYKELLNRHEEYRKIIRDLRNTIWDQSRAQTVEAQRLSNLANQQLKRLETTIEGISLLRNEADQNLGEAKNVVEYVKNNLTTINDIFKEIVEFLVPNLREQHTSLAEVTQDYSKSYQEDHRKAEKHAKDLENQARNLKSFFTEARASSNDALAASTAYSEIILALKNATDAAHLAKSNADEAFAVVDSKLGDSLVNRAREGLNKSTELNQKLDDALNELALTESASRLQNSLKKLDNLSNEMEKNSTWIKNVQKDLDDHHDRINSVHSTVEEADSDLRGVEDSANEFTRSVEELKKRADAIHSYNQQSIKEEISNITESTANIGEVEKSLEKVKSQTDRHNEQLQNIRKDLSVLKEKINEAREKASKIRIAVKSDVGSNCVREYISPMAPTPANIIQLKYRPAMDSPDSLIFFTSTKGTRTQGREYIAVELRSKKIHVKWDVGAGAREAAIIKRNIIYIPASDRYTWYHIEIKRIANTIQVGVVQKQSLNGETARNIDEPTSVTVGEVDLTNHSVFNTLPGQTRIYVGQIDPQMANEIGLSTHRFFGTLGEINVDGVNLPLWVFDRAYGNCDGAAGPPSPIASGHMFRDGFAQIRMPMNERTNTMITVQFSAYSPTGLLYFRGSSSTHEFIALELDNGIVALKADFGDGSKIAIHSAKKYVDGNTHKIRVIRKDGEVHLQIDQDTSDHVSTVLADENAILNIGEPDHYVGGVPPNFDQTPFVGHGIHFSGFFGCIQSVRPNQVSELDLDHPTRSQRKEIGCVYREDRLITSDRLIGFPRPGYLIAKGVELIGESNLSFNFKTRSTNAVLLYESGKKSALRFRRDEEAENHDQTSFGFYLYDGLLVTHLNTNTRSSLTSEQTYNDGFLHSVFLSRKGTEVQVRIDDREVLATTLDDGQMIIGSNQSSLFFGGIPQEFLLQNQQLHTNEPLIGCISDIQLNYERFPIVLQSHQAVLGSCELDRKVMDLASENGTENVEKHGEENAQQNFNRKNSKQSLEPVEPTFMSGEFSSGIPGVFTDKNQYTAIGRNKKRDSSCGTVDAATTGVNFSDEQISEVGARFGVSDSSHARLNFPKPFPKISNFKINFDFRTTQKNGMIWVWANYKNYTRYFYLNLEKGFLVLETKGHKQPKELQYKAKKLNDNQWHHVELEKDDKQIRLQVDNLGAEYMKDAPNPKVMRKRMYVGGVISKHRKQFKLVLPGFEGCIRNFKVDSQPQSLLTTSRDLIPCANSREVAYIHDGGFTTFDPLRNHGVKSHLVGGGLKLGDSPEVEISLRFRSSRPLTTTENEVYLENERPERHPHSDGHSGGGGDGRAESSLILALLSTNENSYQQSRLMVRIENSSLVLSVIFTKHRITFEERLSLANSEGEANGRGLAPVCPGQWHRLSIRLGTHSSIIELDNQTVNLKSLQLTSAALDDLRALPVHIGGTTAPISLALGTKSLFGCFKNLELSGVPIPFESIKKSHKVIQNGCPYA